MSFVFEFFCWCIRGQCHHHSPPPPPPPPPLMMPLASRRRAVSVWIPGRRAAHAEVGVLCSVQCSAGWLHSASSSGAGQHRNWLRCTQDADKIRSWAYLSCKDVMLGPALALRSSLKTARALVARLGSGCDWQSWLTRTGTDTPAPGV